MSMDVYRWIWLTMGQVNTRAPALCLFEWMFPLKKILWLCRPELDSAHYQELLPASSHLHCPVVRSQPLKYVWGIFRGQEVDWLVWWCGAWTWMWRVTKSKLSSLPPSSSSSLELSSITVQQRIIQRLLSPESNPSNCLCFSASIKTSDTLSLESWFATALKAGLCLVNTYQLGQSNCLTASPSKIGLTVVTSCF